jgi:hypothetical protein
MCPPGGRTANPNLEEPELERYFMVASLTHRTRCRSMPSDLQRNRARSP